MAGWGDRAQVQTLRKEVEQLQAALYSACETREGDVQVKYAGKWMPARTAYQLSLDKATEA